MPLKSPILFLIFNRPDTTAQVFQSIRNARPSRLYIAADGPRSNKIGEKEICEKVRQIATNVDWPCEVFTLFREKNLGCGKAVSQGITWFFENEKEGIILEDDCLPHEDFYKYCELMLGKYREEKSIFHISGTSFTSQNVDFKKPYYFSMFAHVWGWATWSDRWTSYKYEVDDTDIKLLLKSYNHNWKYVAYFKDRIRRMQTNKINTWDYQWLFSIWNKQGISIIPTHNLVTNIGTESGTHMKNTKEVKQLQTEKFNFTDVNMELIINDKADNFFFEKMYYIPSLKIVKLFELIKGFLKL